MLKTLFTWLIIIGLNILGLLCIVEHQFVIKSANEEITTLQDWLGPNSFQHIRNQAMTKYNSAFVESGAQDESFKMFVPSRDQKIRSGGMANMNGNAFNWVEQKIKMFWDLIYFGLLRFYHLIFWFPIMLPFVLASIVDGIYTRKIKLITFSYTSSTRYGSSFHVIIFLALFPLFMFIYPLPINPIFIPIWYLLVAFFLRLMISNLHKV